MTLVLRDVAVNLRGMPLTRPLIRPFSVSVQPGEILTIMGPSGSGKSALLSWIGGDLPGAMQGAGEVLLNGVNVIGVPPERRRIGRLFQDDYLFPHMTVGENLLFAIPAARREVRLEMMQQALADAGLDGYAPRAPQTLSGGQRARVALMRTLLSGPAAVLLDEPFSRLDQDLRSTIRSFTSDHIRDRQVPAILVTHDRADVPPGGRVLAISAQGDMHHV